MNTCSMGNPTDREPTDPDFVDADCTCDESCEPHRHFSWGVECQHDGINDHGHCPQGWPTRRV